MRNQLSRRELLEQGIRLWREDELPEPETEWFSRIYGQMDDQATDSSQLSLDVWKEDLQCAGKWPCLKPWMASLKDFR